MAKQKQDFSLRVGEHKVPLTNLDKPLWPAYKEVRPLTKRDLLTYLARVSPYLLPHLHGRPITLTRYPNGIDAKHFYQKHWESKLPPFVDPVTVWSEQFHTDQEYLLCNNLPTLLWLGQLADIELHTWYSRVDPEPDAFDLRHTRAAAKKRSTRRSSTSPTSSSSTSTRTSTPAKRRRAPSRSSTARRSSRPATWRTG